MLAIELSMAKKVVKFLENNFLSLCELNTDIPLTHESLWRENSWYKDIEMRIFFEQKYLHENKNAPSKIVLSPLFSASSLRDDIVSTFDLD